MGAREWDTPRLTEDVHWKAQGRVRGYTDKSPGPVRYRRIAWSGGEVIGYLWYDDAHSAAGYVAVAAQGDDAVNAGTLWHRRLTDAGERGLAPSQAVAEFAEQGVGSRGSGWIVPDSEAEAPSVAELEAVAGAPGAGKAPERTADESQQRRRRSGE
ncbi:hypothetical protein FZ103_19075 [Streptomonospora sp. PA3]|uniref:hypothetical protein n=1 Tax=Streptomonospora sp. PA3 TaxID=2607326 RepID=UPI0012DF9278|nr:hypothetical protein [Streptomonospora sp. PA3]MUL43243.1 hypothetical protein [Streptomonospora sp. PA3]